MVARAECGRSATPSPLSTLVIYGDAMRLFCRRADERCQGYSELPVELPNHLYAQSSLSAQYPGHTVAST